MCPLSVGEYLHNHHSFLLVPASFERKKGGGEGSAQLKLSAVTLLSAGRPKGSHSGRIAWSTGI